MGQILQLTFFPKVMFELLQFWRQAMGDAEDQVSQLVRYNIQRWMDIFWLLVCMLQVEPLGPGFGVSFLAVSFSGLFLT